MDGAEQELSAGALVPVGTWDTLSEAHENVLVLLAAGIDCSIHTTDHRYVLFTHSDDSETAIREIGLYARESAEHPRPPEISWPEHSFGIAWMLVWATILSQVYFAQIRESDFTDRFRNSSQDLIANHEWWRPFTALFLHGDPMHLLGNVMIGGVFCVLVARSLGALCGWMLILLGGTIGNAVNAYLHFPDPFYSIGASTATFAALGILVGVTCAEAVRSRSGRVFRSLSMPLLAGLILFSWLGVSGEMTDVAGHVWGGLSGLLLGAIAGSLVRPVEKSTLTMPAGPASQARPNAGVR